VFFPHDDDWNKTHIGVHHLLVEALGSSGLACLAVETEFWGAMDAPNLMVESSAADVADLVAALSLHVGDGGAVFTNLPLIFAIGVAVGFAKENHGAAALAGGIGYLILTAGAFHLRCAQPAPPGHWFASHPKQSRLVCLRQLYRPRRKSGNRGSPSLLRGRPNGWLLYDWILSDQ
jgi:hypothetical protein